MSAGKVHDTVGNNPHWIISYDIRNVRRLARVEKAVASYGWRVQKSIFESDAPEKYMRILKNRLKKITAPEDNIIIFDICERDWEKREEYGNTNKVDIINGKYSIL